MPNVFKKSVDNQKGSTLLTVVLVLVAVTILGIIATRTSTIELRIAASDKVHKMTWYATDAACDELAPELLEQNIEQRGFSQEPPFTYGETEDLTVYVSNFYMSAEDSICENNVPSAGNRDLSMTGLGETEVSVRIYGDTRLSTGNALQLPEGYHGRGKGLAGGGAQIIYTIRGLGQGAADSEARIATGWRHVI